MKSWYTIEKSNMKKQLLHADTSLVALLVLFIATLLVFIFSYCGALSSSFLRSSIACTEEARVCPGGSVVTRTGPQCEFSACPNDSLPDRPGITEEPFEIPSATVPPKSTLPIIKKGVLCTMEAKACSDGSFVGRTGPQCEFAPCPEGLELDSDH